MAEGSRSPRDIEYEIKEALSHVRGLEMQRLREKFEDD